MSMNLFPVFIYFVVFKTPPQMTTTDHLVNYHWYTMLKEVNDALVHVQQIHIIITS